MRGRQHGVSRCTRLVSGFEPLRGLPSANSSSSTPMTTVSPLRPVSRPPLVYRSLVWMRTVYTSPVWLASSTASSGTMKKRIERRIRLRRSARRFASVSSRSRSCSEMTCVRIAPNIVSNSSREIDSSWFLSIASKSCLAVVVFWSMSLTAERTHWERVWVLFCGPHSSDTSLTVSRAAAVTRAAGSVGKARRAASRASASKRTAEGPRRRAAGSAGGGGTTSIGTVTGSAFAVERGGGGGGGGVVPLPWPWPIGGGRPCGRFEPLRARAGLGFTGCTTCRLAVGARSVL